MNSNSPLVEKFENATYLAQNSTGSLMLKLTPLVSFFAASQHASEGQTAFVMVLSLGLSIASYGIASNATPLFLSKSFEINQSIKGLEARDLASKLSVSMKRAAIWTTLTTHALLVCALK